MLSEAEVVLIDFERSWWLRPGPKDQSIEFDLGLSSAVYYDRLLGVVTRPEAYAHDPLTILRVRSMIEPAPLDAEVAS